MTMNSDCWIIVFTGFTAVATVATALIAGATLIHQIRSERPALLVSIDLKTPPHEPTPVFVTTQVRNVGKVAVSLELCYFTLSTEAGKIIVPQQLMGVPLSYRLEPGTNCGHRDYATRLAQALKARGKAGTDFVSAVYRDELGKTYHSEPMEFDLDHDYGELPPY
ncbi:MAG TPA: hypothetical protein VFI42_01940 [Thermomicrobiaceae bacterium]|nr:hypothetical protein [Thermomicrobiaceae bacterium]